MRLRRQTSTTGRPRRWRIPALLAASALTGTAITIGVAAPSAQAAAPTDAFLGGLGVYTSQCPVTPSNVVYVQPGTTIKFHADLTGLGAVTGAGLLGLETEMTNPLNSRQTFTVTTAPTGAQAVTFGSQGTFPFTWTAKTGYIEAAGIRVNTGVLAAVTGAKLTWQGQVVVSSRAQTCSLAPQLPSVEVSPSLPVVGQLPGVSVPGVQLPGVNVPGTTQNPTNSSSAAATAAAAAEAAAAATGSTTVNPYSYDPAACGPCNVVPRGSGNGGRVGAASGVTFNDLDDPAAGGSSSAGSAAADGTADGAAFVAGGNDADAQLAVDRAFADGGNGLTDGPGLPTGLTIAAVAALAGASVLWFARRRLARG